MVSNHESDADGGSELPSRRKLLATIATAGAAGLAGCSVEDEEQAEPFEAKPVVLTETGQGIMGLTEFEVEAQTRTVSPSGSTAEVEATSYLTVHSRPGDHQPPKRFWIPDPTTRTFGILSMPAAEGLGEAVNPMATEPLEELLVGEHGRDFLAQSGAVDAPAFDWQQPPEQIGRREVEVFETATEARSFMGIAVGEDWARTIVANIARIEYDGSVILFVESMWRIPPEEPIDPDDIPQKDPNCLDDRCQFLPSLKLGMWQRFEEVIKYFVTACTEIPIEGEILEVCGSGGGGSTEQPPTPTFRISDARLVQQVEDTVVKPPDGSTIHTESNPDLVEGDNTAVVFEFDRLEHLDEMSDPLEVEVERKVGSSNSQTEDLGTFELTQSELKGIKKGINTTKKGEHTTSVLHRIGRSGDTTPVFDVTPTPSVYVTATNTTYDGFFENVTENDGVAGQRDVVDLDPLKVGFIRIFDGEGGNRYGNSAGWPRDFMRSFESATEYLQRAYPGDVVTYAHLKHAIAGTDGIPGLCNGSCVVIQDMKNAKSHLDSLVAPPQAGGKGGKPFPGSGALRLDGLDRSTMVNEIENSGFDVVVAIVPGVATNNSGADHYYDYFGLNWAGITFGDHDAAVSSLGVNPTGNDQGTSTTVAHEVGHYFQTGINLFNPSTGRNYLGPSGHPMAQRDNDSDDDNQQTVNGKPIDSSHARHQKSNRVSGGDDPGVVSTAYDLEDGFANMQEFMNAGGSFSVTEPSSAVSSIDKVPSYMSYTDNDDSAWADARIHKDLIDSAWDPGFTSGSGDARFMLRGMGGVAEDGSIRYGDVSAMPGFDRYDDFDDAPVTVELLGPDGEVLESARVPLTVTSTHDHGHVGEEIEMPSFTLPFADRSVEVRTTYEERPASMNPIERSVRDAFRRVPVEGIQGDPEEARTDVGEVLDEVAAAMDDGVYDGAAELMDERVRVRIQERVREYEAALNEPTLAELMGLVDEMVRRLQVVAETAG